MAQLKKAKVTLGGVPLAAGVSLGWKFTTGVSPYSAIFTVHKSQWASLKSQRGKPITLSITDARGSKLDIKHLYILHESPSGSPNRVSFVVSDKRWKWQYKLVARDYNMPRKTGDRTADFTSVPVETRVTIDEYDYLPYSLNGKSAWKAEDALRDVLAQVEDSKSGGFRIESFPIRESAGTTAGSITLQGITLRDQGDVAISRLLGYIPGANLYVNAEGKTVIYNATDIQGMESYFRSLPSSTWAGEKAAWIDRIKIRPSKVYVYYEREVEAVFEFTDDYNSTVAEPDPDDNYLDNVLPTTDPKTTLTEYDSGSKGSGPKTVPPGTWVKCDAWLKSMNADKPSDSVPWDFDAIRVHWLKGDLDGVLGARGMDRDAEANVAMRVQTLRQHFRQTFRINRRYMERIKNIRPVRAAMLDPVTGSRAPAAVWGEACNVPSNKGKYMATRNADVTKYKIYRNIDNLAPHEAGANLYKTAPGPAGMRFIDNELGIFRVEWINSPYGDIASWIPCHLVDQNGEDPKVITRDLTQQDKEPVGAAIKVESGTNGIFLKKTMDLKVMATIVPAAPNNKKRFHREEVEVKDISKLFKKNFSIEKGDGPPLELYVSPGEATARFAWMGDTMAKATIKSLLGLDNEDPNTAGIEGPDLPGFTIVNGARYLKNHAMSYAAEMMMAFADSVQGAISTVLPRDGLKIVGNMGGSMVRVGQSPSAKVDAIHQFSGQQKQVSRLSLMSESARAVVLGIVQFKE